MIIRLLSYQALFKHVPTGASYFSDIIISTIDLPDVGDSLP